MLKIRRPLGRLIFDMGIAIPGKTVFLIETAPRALSQYKDSLSRYGDSHYKDETVVRPSYLYNGNPYTAKMISLYWDGPLNILEKWSQQHGSSLWRQVMSSHDTDSAGSTATCFPRDDFNNQHHLSDEKWYKMPTYFYISKKRLSKARAKHSYCQRRHENLGYTVQSCP